jgi:predicted transcriptional regulator
MSVKILTGTSGGSEGKPASAESVAICIADACQLMVHSHRVDTGRHSVVQVSVCRGTYTDSDRSVTGYLCSQQRVLQVEPTRDVSFASRRDETPFYAMLLARVM